MPPKSVKSTQKSVKSTQKSAKKTNSVQKSTQKSAQKSDEIIQKPNRVEKNGLDFKVDLYDYIPHGRFQKGRMRIIFTGNDANSQFVNSIGRIMMDRVPTYAFARELVKVERIDPESGYHDSIAINHDMLTEAIENIPVSNVDPNIYYLHEKFWKGINYLDDEREVHPVENRIEMNIDVRNENNGLDEESNIFVTTNDFNIFIDDQRVVLHDEKYPYVLLELKPREQIRLSARAVLGVGFRHACWQAASNYAIDTETKDDSVILLFEAASRFNEYVLMEKALLYFKDRLELLCSELEEGYENEDEKTDKFIGVIIGEDATIACAYAYELQTHPDTLGASFSIPNDNETIVNITIQTDDPELILKIIRESKEKLMQKIKTTQNQFDALKKRTYSLYLDENGKSKFINIEKALNKDPVIEGV